MLSAQKGKRQFLETVFPAEIEEIKKIRQRRGLDTDTLKGSPSTGQGLGGLALSGGGIRAASFCLGVIQSLGKHGVLKSIDYLSTVSGGGFVGTCICSALNTDLDLQAEKSPFLHKIGVEESATLRHLRASSKYLAPGGFLYRLRLPTLLLRGMIINISILLTLIALVAVPLTDLLFELRHFLSLFYQNIFFIISWSVFLALVFLFPFVFRPFIKVINWRLRNAYEIMLTVSLLIPLMLIVLAALTPAVSLAIEHSWAEVKEWLLHSSPFQLKDYWIWLVVIAAVIILLFIGAAFPKISRWMVRITAYLTGLMGPVVLILFYLLMCAVQINAPFIDKNVDGLASKSAKKEFSREIARNLDNGKISETLRQVLEKKGAPENVAVKVRKNGAWWEITNNEKNQIYWTIKTDRGRLRIIEPNIWDRKMGVVYFGALAFLLILLFFVDVNTTSAGVFYRDRLSKAYLFRINEDGSVTHRDRQKLSDLHSQGPAPYLLINTALNMQGSKDPMLLDRGADFFIFSKHFVGSYSTGFCKTEDIEKYDNLANLGTAMAISGAAVAPNRGYTTVRALTFITTLLNIRLNYWLPNPLIINSMSKYKKVLLSLPLPLMYLWKEAVGKLDTRGLYANLSDGGHIENLGIYELLRRRCKFIIAVDAGRDQNFVFSDLIKLIRFARIDMGVNIEIDLNELRPNVDGFNKNHWALGKIHYSESETGHLLYIKVSLTGDENEYIREYHSRYPDYPHQPMTYQFFDEPQYEAYRALGYHSTNKMIDEISQMADFKLFE